MPNRVVSLQHPGTGSPFPGVWFEKQIAMKRFFLLLFLGACPAVSAQVRFSDYFLEETMRFDYYHSGDSRSEEYFFDALKADPYWAGSHVSLLDRDLRPQCRGALRKAVQPEYRPRILLRRAVHAPLRDFRGGI